MAYCTTLSRLDNDLIGFFNRHVEIREKAIHARFFVAENGGNNGRYSAKSQQLRHLNFNERFEFVCLLHSLHSIANIPQYLSSIYAACHVSTDQGGNAWMPLAKQVIIMW